AQSQRARRQNGSGGSDGRSHHVRQFAESPQNGSARSSPIRTCERQTHEPGGTRPKRPSGRSPPRFSQRDIWPAWAHFTIFQSLAVCPPLENLTALRRLSWYSVSSWRNVPSFAGADALLLLAMPRHGSKGGGCAWFRFAMPANARMTPRYLFDFRRSAEKPRASYRGVQ